MENGNLLLVLTIGINLYRYQVYRNLLGVRTLDAMRATLVDNEEHLTFYNSWNFMKKKKKNLVRLLLSLSFFTAISHFI